MINSAFAVTILSKDDDYYLCVLIPVTDYDIWVILSCNTAASKIVKTVLLLLCSDSSHQVSDFNLQI